VRVRLQRSEFLKGARSRSNRVRTLGIWEIELLKIRVVWDEKLTQCQVRPE
jgi:hypothetical protein